MLERWPVTSSSGSSVYSMAMEPAMPPVLTSPYTAPLLRLSDTLPSVTELISTLEASTIRSPVPPVSEEMAENIVFVSSLNLLLMLRISAERAVLVFLTFSVISESWLFAAVTEPTTMLMFDTVTTSETSKS